MYGAAMWAFGGFPPPLGGPLIGATGSGGSTAGGGGAAGTVIVISAFAAGVPGMSAVSVTV